MKGSETQVCQRYMKNTSITGIGKTDIINESITGESDLTTHTFRSSIVNKSQQRNDRSEQVTQEKLEEYNSSQ